MVFRSTTDKATETKQLAFNNTHLSDTDDRRNIIYDKGIPDLLIFNVVGQPERAVTVEPQPIMVIGRKRSLSDYEVAVDLTDFGASEYGVSRYHAMLLALDNHIVIKDIDSLNGTRLNGMPIKPSVEYVIDNGDTITFSELELEVTFGYNR